MNLTTAKNSRYFRFSCLFPLPVSDSFVLPYLLLTNWYKNLRIPQPTASVRYNLPLPTLEPHQIDHDYFTRFRKQSGAMDPNIQLLLDEIKSVKATVNGVESRVGAVETSLAAESPPWTVLSLIGSVAWRMPSRCSTIGGLPWMRLWRNSDPRSAPCASRRERLRRCAKR